MRLSNCIFGLAILGFLGSCGANDNAQLSKKITADTIQLQQYGGMMPVRKVYSISANSVKEDTSHRTGDTTFYLFNKLIEGDKANQVKSLLNEIPEDLLREQMILIGEPHFEVDGTATYVIIYKDGRKYTYLLADDLVSLPEYLQPFAQKVQQAFATLR